jgi:hypothetical protein
MARFKSQKYGELDEEARRGQGQGQVDCEGRVGGRVSVREGGTGGGGGGSALLQAQATDEISVIAETLWLIRSSGMFRRLVKHTKRTNLVEPTDNINQLLTVL